MKYNSIGEQLVAKAKELDPNYKPDKFNDLSEALDIILNNTNSNSTKYYEITITRILFDYDSKTTDEKANYVSYATDYTLKFIINETNYNTLLNGISTELGVTVDTAYLLNNYNTLKQTPEYIRNFVGLLIVSVVGSLSSIINATSLAYINNCCYMAIPRIEGADSWFKCSSGFFGTLCAYDSDKEKMAKIGYDGVAEDSILTIVEKSI